MNSRRVKKIYKLFLTFYEEIAHAKQAKVINNWFLVASSFILVRIQVFPELVIFSPENKSYCDLVTVKNIKILAFMTKVKEFMTKIKAFMTIFAYLI